MTNGFVKRVLTIMNYNLCDEMFLLPSPKPIITYVNIDNTDDNKCICGKITAGYRINTENDFNTSRKLH